MKFRVALAMMAIILPAWCDENLKPPAKVTTTQRLDFAPGGLIQVDGSRGDLYVEAWDQPQVELTVTKFVPFEYEPGRPAWSTQEIEAVRVTAEERSKSELDISTTPTARREIWWPLTWGPNRNPVRLEYQLHVPRSSRLVIRHDVGLVSVAGVTGDIQATCHRGDIVLWLPESGTYQIDAKNKLGKVSSDFTGQSRARFVVGQKFIAGSSSPAQRLYLRMGFGGITLKPILPESEPTNPSPGGAK